MLVLILAYRSLIKTICGGLLTQNVYSPFHVDYFFDDLVDRIIMAHIQLLDNQSTAKAFPAFFLELPLFRQISHCRINFKTFFDILGEKHSSCQSYAAGTTSDQHNFGSHFQGRINFPVGSVVLQATQASLARHVTHSSPRDVTSQERQVRRLLRYLMTVLSGPVIFMPSAYNRFVCKPVVARMLPLPFQVPGNSFRIPQRPCNILISKKLAEKISEQFEVAQLFSLLLKHISVPVETLGKRFCKKPRDKNLLEKPLLISH